MKRIKWHTVKALKFVGRDDFRVFHNDVIGVADVEALVFNWKEDVILWYIIDFTDRRAIILHDPEEKLSQIIDNEIISLTKKFILDKNTKKQ
jgi:hypothetical protein